MGYRAPFFMINLHMQKNVLSLQRFYKTTRYESSTDFNWRYDFDGS